MVWAGASRSDGNVYWHVKSFRQKWWRRSMYLWKYANATFTKLNRPYRYKDQQKVQAQMRGRTPSAHKRPTYRGTVDRSTKEERLAVGYSVRNLIYPLSLVWNHWKTAYRSKLGQQDLNYNSPKREPTERTEQIPGSDQISNKNNSTYLSKEYMVKTKQWNIMWVQGVNVRA